MKTNMCEWLINLPKSKKPMPVLSFPCISLLGCSVKELISDSNLLAEGMKVIADRTDSAAAISFMDLSVEASAFGAYVTEYEDEVPTVSGRIVDSTEQAQKLEIPKVSDSRCQIYINAVEKACKIINDKPVFAGMIGPFSLAARILDVSQIMIDCFINQEMVHIVLEKATTFLIEYAKAYKNAGANGIFMAEPVAGILSPSLEAEFSSPYVKRIVDEVQDEGFAVVYHNCGTNINDIIDSVLSCGCYAYHFGNATDMQKILERVPPEVVVMGNVDPALMRMGTPDQVREETSCILNKCKNYKNFVLSTGCDVPPLCPWENIDAFFFASKEW